MRIDLAHPKAIWAEIYLNGERITTATVADEEKGYVICYVQDKELSRERNRTIVKRNGAGAPETEVRRGKVEIRFANEYKQ